MSKNCPVCRGEASSVSFDALKDETTVVCPTCGRFTITTKAKESIDMDMLASYLYYHSIFDESKNSFHSYFYVCYDAPENSDYWVVTYDMVENWYPKSFSEKVDLFLLLLEEKSNYMGYDVLFSDEQIISACFAKRNITGYWEHYETEKEDQCEFFVNYLKEQQYIGKYPDITQLSIAPNGYKRIDELQKNNSDNRDVFIAMSFDPKNDNIKEALKIGIKKAGYAPRIMSEEIHGKQIVPMMFRLIRESKLLVMDATDPNLGAYHEAGYALGLGKEVIITCREKEFSDPKNKPHFDIAQKQILVWKDYEDLTVRLSEWIKAIAG